MIMNQFVNNQNKKNYYGKKVRVFHKIIPKYHWKKKKNRLGKLRKQLKLKKNNKLQM